MTDTLPSEAVGDVTGMAAILAMLISVCCKLHAAGCTSEMIDCFSLNAVKVTIPPDSAARIRAELPRLLFWDNLDGFTALLAAHGVFSGFTVKSISAAEGANCIMRDTKSLPDFYIPSTL